MVRLNQDIIKMMIRFRPPYGDIRKRVEQYGLVRLGASPDNYSRRTKYLLWSNLIREYEIESLAVCSITDSMPGRSDSW